MPDSINLLSWVYFPVAIMLGGLHALEPGHAKTLIASYLIGIKGSKFEAVLLGISVAITHSIVVIGLAAAAVFIGAESFSQTAMDWLHVGSAWVVIALGTWMLFRRVRCSHGHHHHGHSHSHEAGVPKDGQHPSWVQIVLFGAAGGLIPCPASVTVMILAVSTGKMVNGLVAVSGFSLGLAATLVGVGVLVVSGIKRVSLNSGWPAWLSKYSPVISAVMVIVSGVLALVLG